MSPSGQTEENTSASASASPSGAGGFDPDKMAEELKKMGPQALKMARGAIAAEVAKMFGPAAGQLIAGMMEKMLGGMNGAGTQATNSPDASQGSEKGTSPPKSAGLDVDRLPKDMQTALAQANESGAVEKWQGTMAKTDGADVIRGNFDRNQAAEVGTKQLQDSVQLA